MSSPKFHTPILLYAPHPTGAGLRPRLPDHGAVRAGRLLVAAGPSFSRAATAALDAFPVRSRVDSAACARPRLPVHRGRSERLGPGERGSRWSRREGNARASNSQHHTSSKQCSSVSLQLSAPSSPRCPSSSLSSSPRTPCCPWACGPPPPRASPRHSHTCWSSACILGLSQTHGPRCCRR